MKGRKSMVFARVSPHARGFGIVSAALRVGAVAAPLLFGGCASSTVISGPVGKSTCLGPNHDVANLGATDPRKTYGCKADNDGYLAEARSAPVVGY
jgi:hypothetical protein